MTVSCPYCGTEIDGLRSLPVLMRPRWIRIYIAVLQAGILGIKSDDLLVRMYAENEWPTPGGDVVLRVMIHGINKVIGDHPFHQRIISNHRTKSYRLVSLKEKRHVKIAEEVQ